MADDKNQNDHDSEYIGGVLKPKQRKYRKREKVIAAVSIVAFIILVIISSLFMLQDAERAVDGNVELEYPIGDGENAAANTERFSDAESRGYFLFGDDADGNTNNMNDAIDSSINENSPIAIDTATTLS